MRVLNPEIPRHLLGYVRLKGSRELSKTLPITRTRQFPIISQLDTEFPDRDT